MIPVVIRQTFISITTNSSNKGRQTFFFFFLMIRRPPRSPFFPYTTFFRSVWEPPFPDRGEVAVIVDEPAIDAPATDFAFAEATLRKARLRLIQIWPYPAHRAADEVIRSQDRKSTRLNSSHSQISYAVFCLE